MGNIGTKSSRMVERWFVFRRKKILNFLIFFFVCLGYIDLLGDRQKINKNTIQTPPPAPTTNAVCGNGQIEPGEQWFVLLSFAFNRLIFYLYSDDTGSCCINCKIAPSGVICRDSDGLCDAPERCDGEFF